MYDNDPYTQDPYNDDPYTNDPYNSDSYNSYSDNIPSYNSHKRSYGSSSYKRYSSSSSKSMTLGDGLAWYLGIIFVSIILSLGFKLVCWIYPCQMVVPFHNFPLIYKIIIAIFSLIVGISTYTVVKENCKIVPGCFMAVFFISNHCIMAFVVGLVIFSMINALDFYNKPNVRYEYVVNRDSKGEKHSSYHKGRKSESESWTYYILVKPDIESDDSNIRKIKVSRSVYDSAEVGDDWAYNTKPGLLGIEHYSKNPHIVNNHLTDRIRKGEFIKGSERYELTGERGVTVTRIHSLQALKKKYPNSTAYDLEIEMLEKKVEKITKRLKEMELELYKSLHRNDK